MLYVIIESAIQCPNPLHRAGAYSLSTMVRHAPLEDRPIDRADEETMRSCSSEGSPGYVVGLSTISPWAWGLGLRSSSEQLGSSHVVGALRKVLTT